jgi:ubiquinone/menaquinone biosynthesis C-methylase UbiE
VLDVGCGLGATVNWLEENHGLRAVGLDVSPSLLEESRRQSPSAVLTAGRADRLPYADRIFDGLFCECVLSLLDEPGHALDEFRRVLKTEGWLVVADLYARRPEGAPMLKRLSMNSCLKGAMPRREIVGAVENAGFKVALWEDRSDLLKQLAARLVFEYGSMKQFWAIFAPQCSGPELDRSIGMARPGYFLMAARKRNRADE